MASWPVQMTQSGVSREFRGHHTCTAKNQVWCPRNLNLTTLIGRYLDKARAGGFISPPEARDGLSGFRTRPRASVTSTEASNGEEVMNRLGSFRRLSLPGQKAHILTNTHHRALVCPFAIPRLSFLERDATSRARSLRFQTK